MQLIAVFCGCRESILPDDILAGGEEVVGQEEVRVVDDDGASTSATLWSLSSSSLQRMVGA